MKKTLVIVLVFLVLGFALFQSASAFPNLFQIDWWRVAGGGDTSTGGDFSLTGTIGQPEAGPLMSGGEFTVAGGFWGVGSPPSETNTVYLPLLTK